VADSDTNAAPWLERDFPQADARDAFSAQTAATPLPQGAESAFIANKLQILRSHPVPPPERRRLVQGFLDSLYLKTPLIESRPVPGGVGYGMFYTPTFKTAFQSGTGLAWGIVCPTPPGGNVSDWLYLTGMNRASMGTEAFVAYHGQNDMTFNVFDWSRSPQWQIHRPMATMADYLGTVATNENQFPAIQVVNLTYQNGATSWVNEVRLLNHATGNLDVAYQYVYTATLQQQTSQGVGSWAAIVETFQPAYTGTSPMGCFDAKINSMDPNGEWGQWSLLDPSQVFLRVDNKGFHQLFIDPDYSWAVIS
jgi:hypothetical protein